MVESDVVMEVNSFDILIVDDDDEVCNGIRECLKDIPKTRCELIVNPEEIEEPEIVKNTYSLIFLDVIFEKGKNCFEYLFSCTKKYWPNAIIVVLSNYTFDLSEKQQEAVEIVINKALFRVDPQILITELVKTIPQHAFKKCSIAREVYDALVQVELPELKEELHVIKGHVLQRRGEYIETLIVEHEELTNKLVRRKVLFPHRMFLEDGLEGVGTPFVFRIYGEGRRIVAEVQLDKEAEEPTEVPEEIDKFLTKMEEEDERARKGQIDDGKV